MLNPFRNVAEKNREFIRDIKIIEEMVNFLKKRNARSSREMDDSLKLVNNVPAADRKIAMVLDQIVAQKLDNENTNLKLFGRHCEDVRDITTRASEIIQKRFKNIPLEEADLVITDLLQLAKDRGLIYSYKDIPLRILGERKDIRGFVCF